jgi:hypothetical protein
MGYFMKDGQRWRSWKRGTLEFEQRCHHLSPREAPARVRRAVVDGWFQMVAKLRGMSNKERRTMLLKGAPLQIGHLEYLVRCNYWDGSLHVTIVGWDGPGKRLPGNAASFTSLPVTYLDDLQDLTENLLLENVMEL